MDDVYYNPEKFDLTPLAELELTEPSYSFDTVVVWRHTSGKLYWAHDSGCSCPSPFEDYTSLESLDALTDYDELARYVEHCYDTGAKLDFLRKVREATAEKRVIQRRTFGGWEDVEVWEA